MKVGTLIHPSRLAEALLSPPGGGVLEPLVKRCVAEGASHIELTGELFILAPPQLLDHLAREIRGPLAALQREQGISFSVHLPYMGGLDISSSVGEIRSASVGTFKKIADITRPLSPENYVLHVAGMLQEATHGDVVGNASSGLTRILLEHAVDSLDRITSFLEPNTICVENLPIFPMEYLAAFVDRCGVSVCLDLGHLTLRGEPLDLFLERYGRRIREVHLHDVKTVRHSPNLMTQYDHFALGDGDLDLEGIVRTLRAHGFNGPVVLEILKDRSISSVSRLKRLLDTL